jgi:hypothetical protein
LRLFFFWVFEGDDFVGGVAGAELGEQLLVHGSGGDDGEGDALKASDVVAFEDGEALAGLIEDVKDGFLHTHEGGGAVLGEGLGSCCADEVSGGCGAGVGADLVDEGVALPAEPTLEGSDDLEGEQDERGGDGGFDVEACAAGHADGGYDEDGGGAGEADGLAFGVEDEAGAEEADALDDIGGDLAAVGGLVAGDDDAHDGEQRGTHGDEQVGAEAGVLVTPLALHTDETAHGAGHDEARGGTLREEHLLEGGEVEMGGVDHGLSLLLTGVCGRRVRLGGCSFGGRVGAVLDSDAGHLPGTSPGHDGTDAA